MRRPRVLIVDDEMALCAALARRLRARFEVVIAQDGVDALERLENGERFQAIVCDIQMAKMTGPYFRDSVARLQPGMLPRLIFMTGHASGPQRERVADHFVLEKPFDFDALHALLAKVVDAARDGYFPTAPKP